ncbi:MAG: class I SAM-dependent methyltransferase [Planctomycetota bacterium]|jgi:SAM-dependent methyltransferase
MTEELAKCILCGSDNLKRDLCATRKLNLSEPHSVMKCKVCSFRFLNPRPDGSEYEQLYKDGSGPLADIYGFSDEFYEQEATIRIAEYKKKLDILRKMGAKGRLLELGSCTGAFLNEARNLGFEVEGIEPSEKNCSIAKERYGLSLHVGCVEEENFQDGYFDVVFSSHVFEHLPDPLAIAKKISAWLCPDGFHMIEVPNQFEASLSKLRRLLFIDRPRALDFRSIHHPVFFSPKTLKCLVELSGCRKIHMRNVYYSSTNIFKNPKGAVNKLLSDFGGGGYSIEILAQKR